MSAKSLIAVCVDMLGEGFDLPELKIAAFHDIRKILAVTLQLAGRFMRARPALGAATFTSRGTGQACSAWDPATQPAWLRRGLRPKGPATARYLINIKNCRCDRSVPRVCRAHSRGLPPAPKALVRAGAIGRDTGKQLTLNLIRSPRT